MGAENAFIHFHSNAFELQVSFQPRRLSTKNLSTIGVVETTAIGEGEEFARWVLEFAGLNAGAYRSQPLIRRVPACLRALGVPNESAARAKLRQDPGLLSVAINAFLVGVTEFYRDPAAMRDLEALVDAKPGFFKNCKVWSVGCSTGAEAYTLGMVMDSRGLLEGGKLVGSDCRGAAIKHARDGVYPKELIKGIPAEYERYLDACGTEHVAVKPRLMEMAAWHIRDALEDAGWDELFHVVACRNMAIYLNRDTTDRLWGRLYDSLLPGGLLLTGRAETVPDGLGMARVGCSIYRKECRTWR